MRWENVNDLQTRRKRRDKTNTLVEYVRTQKTNNPWGCGDRSNIHIIRNAGMSI